MPTLTDSNGYTWYNVTCESLPSQLDSSFSLFQGSDSARIYSADFRSSGLTSVGDFFSGRYRDVAVLQLSLNSHLVFDESSFAGLSEVLEVWVSSVDFMGMYNVDLSYMKKLRKYVGTSVLLPHTFDWSLYNDLNAVSYSTKGEAPLDEAFCTSLSGSLEELNVQCSINSTYTCVSFVQIFPNDCFIGFSKLRGATIMGLNVSRSALTSVESLTYLSLASCDIPKSAFNSLYFLENLRELYFDSPTIDGASMETFPDASNLNHLFLHLERFSFVRGNLKYLPILPENSSLNEFVVTKCKIQSFSLQTFAQMENLTSLDLSENKISSLVLPGEMPITQCSSNSSSKMSKITLSYNLLLEFPNNLGCYFPKLTEIDVSNNLITNLSINAPLQMLSVLLLTNNSIAEIVIDSVISWNEELNSPRLDISQNNLTFVPKELFGENCAIDFLNIQENSFNDFSFYGFYNVCSITYMNVSFNQFSTLDTVFEGFPGLYQLYAQSNFLKNFSYSNPKSNVDDDDDSIMILDLSNNTLQSCSDMKIFNSGSLGNLNFSRNFIETLNGECFGVNSLSLGESHDIHLLDFSENPIAQISSETFRNFITLQNLFLSGLTKVNRFPDGLVVNCSSESVLGLKFNASNGGLKEFDATKVFTKGTYVSQLVLSNNSLNSFPIFNSSLWMGASEDVASHVSYPLLYDVSYNENIEFDSSSCPSGIDTTHLKPGYVQTANFSNTAIWAKQADSIISCSAFSWLDLSGNPNITFVSSSWTSAHTYALFLDELDFVGLPYNFHLNFPTLQLLNLPSSIPCSNFGWDNLNAYANAFISVPDKSFALDFVFQPQVFNSMGSYSVARYYDNLKSGLGMTSELGCTLENDIVTLGNALSYFTEQNASWVCPGTEVIDYNTNITFEMNCSNFGSICVDTDNYRAFCVCKAEFEGDGYICVPWAVESLDSLLDLTTLIIVVAALFTMNGSIILFAFLLIPVFSKRRSKLSFGNCMSLNFADSIGRLGSTRQSESYAFSTEREELYDSPPDDQDENARSNCLTGYLDFERGDIAVNPPPMSLNTLYDTPQDNVEYGGTVYAYEGIDGLQYAVLKY